jgi:hypothetical protein
MRQYLNHSLEKWREMKKNVILARIARTRL